jgi:hypothetical protein
MLRQEKCIGPLKGELPIRAHDLEPTKPHSIASMEDSSTIICTRMVCFKPAASQWREQLGKTLSEEGQIQYWLSGENDLEKISHSGEAT